MFVDANQNPFCLANGIHQMGDLGVAQSVLLTSVTTLQLSSPPFSLHRTPSQGV
jgi:hypothetical protein